MKRFVVGGDNFTSPKYNGMIALTNMELENTETPTLDMHDAATGDRKQELILTNFLWQCALRVDLGEGTDNQKVEHLMERFTNGSSNSILQMERTCPEWTHGDGSIQVNFAFGRQNEEESLGLPMAHEIMDAYEKKDRSFFSQRECVDFILEGNEHFSMEYMYPREDGAELVEVRQEDIAEGLRNMLASYGRMEDIVFFHNASLFDSFYDKAKGGEMHIGRYGIVQLAHIKPKVPLKVSPILDSDGVLRGASITGRMPELYDSGNSSYILYEGHLSRLTREELFELTLLYEVAQSDGSICINVAAQYLASFIYYTLARLRSFSYVRVENDFLFRVELLPPKPVFSFYLKRKNATLSCSLGVSYGKKSFLVQDDQVDYPFRDTIRETEMLKTLEAYFPSREEDQFFLENTPDNTYLLWKTILPELSSLGKCITSRDFPKIRKGNFDGLYFSLSMVDSHLNLRLVKTKGSKGNRKKLVSILEARQEKKDFYEYKNGDLVDIKEEPVLFEIANIISVLGCSAKDITGENMDYPLAYAPFLSSVLGKCEAVKVSIDENVQVLIKRLEEAMVYNEKEGSIPLSLAAELRPYQLDGVNWLHTLYGVAPGAILADDMGLGKTCEALGLLRIVSLEKKTGLI